MSVNDLLEFLDSYLGCYNHNTTITLFSSCDEKVLWRGTVGGNNDLPGVLLCDNVWSFDVYSDTNSITINVD